MSDLRTEIVELVGTVRSYTDPGDTADDILALLAERLTSDDTVREVADVHEALAPHPLMRELLVRGILNTATYAAGVRTAPGDAGVTTGEGVPFTPPDLTDAQIMDAYQNGQVFRPDGSTDGTICDGNAGRIQRIAELEAQVTRLQSAVRHHCDHRANDMMRRQGFSAQEWSDTAKALAAGAGLHPGDLDPVNGGDDGE